jgi:hypothetical protein
MAVVALLAIFPSKAAAQTGAQTPAQTPAPSDPNRGYVNLSGGFDLANAYMFRGLRQDDTRLIMWPSADAGFRLVSDANGASRAVLHVGSWNSLHTGLTGSEGPTQRLWYESDFYTTLAFAVVEGVGVGATYTAYTSPNSSFSTVKELSFKVAADESIASTGAPFAPYALIAFELDTRPGLGQADGGQRAGTYLEFGAAPKWPGVPIDVAFPIRVGLSLRDYYELAGIDHRFGFLSLGARASVPIVRTGNYGAWNVHGEVDFLSLGDTPEAFNAGEQNKIVASVGIGFSY